MRSGAERPVGEDSAGMDKGMDAMVRTLAVTFSPSAPSPRVAPCVSWPFSYVSATATPSIFGSTVIRGRKAASPNCASSPRTHRSYQDFSSPASNAFPRDSMATGWRTRSNRSSGAAPVRCVGESSVTRSG